MTLFGGADNVFNRKYFENGFLAPRAHRQRRDQLSILMRNDRNDQAPMVAASLNAMVLVSWSGGKDSCFALYETQMAAEHRVAALLTTLTRDYDRISMHGVRRELLEEQAASLGLPLHQVFISKDASNDEYEMKMGEAFSEYREAGNRFDSLW